MQEDSGSGREGEAKRVDREAIPVPLGLRLGIGLLSFLLTLLLVWLLNFLLSDIGSMRGPNWEEVRKQHVDAALLERVEVLEARGGELSQQAERQVEIQKDLRRSMDNAGETMKQMIELRRLGLEQGNAPDPEEAGALTTAQETYIAAQEKFETANAEIEAANAENYAVAQDLGGARSQIDAQEMPAREAYEVSRRAHRLRVAGVKLLVIVPLFLLACLWVYRWRNSPYRALALATLSATAWVLVGVMHAHFPTDFFKYIAILAGIFAAVGFLVWLVRKATRPRPEVVLLRNREGYERNRCPVCAYPILRGALRHAVWGKSGPVVPGGMTLGGGGESEKPYDCPSCGNALFEQCQSCDGIRHSLLPFCEHCGVEERSD